jgi:hypothetical protein
LENIYELGAKAEILRQKKQIRSLREGFRSLE